MGKGVLQICLEGALEGEDQLEFKSSIILTAF